ncbi:MAG: hypothetical protein RLZ32_914 [Gemmatimonadota bacterium]|jgi:hypothetical protein
MPRLLAPVATALLAVALPTLAAAQAGGHAGHQAGHQMDHKAMHEGDNHAASGWKALDAYHALMMATWHPAKDKGDMAPLKAQAVAMVTAAKAVAASTPPAGCATPALAKAAAALPGQTQAVADLVAKGTADPALKDALKGLHDHFEVLEQGCQPKAGGAKK